MLPISWRFVVQWTRAQRHYFGNSFRHQTERTGTETFDASAGEGRSGRTMAIDVGTSRHIRCALYKYSRAAKGRPRPEAPGESS
ncbi:hypothetical protein ZHAS_00011428 [Anopheles sinensis]|uniref:Uncharacterized protein n=1 Tax=Anopheles sinensis TaxID=74873 RepID=A0A084W0F3_ANOSI|nr:hypothetical protein ZHAS_00011428 [Anopheles sinensis]